MVYLLTLAIILGLAWIIYLVEGLVHFGTHWLSYSAGILGILIWLIVIKVKATHRLKESKTIKNEIIEEVIEGVVEVGVDVVGEVASGTVEVVSKAADHVDI